MQNKLIQSGNVTDVNHQPNRITCSLNLIICWIWFFRFRYLFTYLLTPWSRVLLEKLTGLQLVQKFPTFYRTRRFMNTFTIACHLSLSWASSIQSIPPTSNFLKIQLNIILPSMPRSSQWSLSPRFPHQNPTV